MLEKIVVLVSVLTLFCGCSSGSTNVSYVDETDTEQTIVITKTDDTDTMNYFTSEAGELFEKEDDTPGLEEEDDELHYQQQRAWRKAYTEHLMKSAPFTAGGGYYGEYDDVMSCYLLYVNDDDIPELIEIGSYMAGLTFVTWDGEQVIEEFMAGSNTPISLMEKKNLLHMSTSIHDSGYYDSIVSIENNRMNWIAGGEIVVTDWEKQQYEYYWEDVKQSDEDEYQARIDEYIDPYNRTDAYLFEHDVKETIKILNPGIESERTYAANYLGKQVGDVLEILGGDYVVEDLEGPMLAFDGLWIFPSVSNDGRSLFNETINQIVVRDNCEVVPGLRGNTTFPEVSKAIEARGITIGEPEFMHDPFWDVQIWFTSVELDGLLISFEWRDDPYNTACEEISVYGGGF